MMALSTWASVTLCAALALTPSQDEKLNHAPQPVPAEMRAVRLHQFGGPEVLREEKVPTPRPGDDELLVRVEAAGVNPVDFKMRDGMGRGMLRLPFTLGYDVAGTVVDKGASVRDFDVGDSVFAYLSLQRGGGYAQYAIVQSNEAARTPRDLLPGVAASVPLAALTAWQALVEIGQVEKGQTVLIHGGAGGVGHFAVQIAKARGARVIATASAKNQEFLRQLGADETVDYRARPFEDVAKDVDLVLDPIGGTTTVRSMHTLRKGGILISIVGEPGPEAMELAKERGVRTRAMLVRPDGKQLREIAALIEAGSIRPHVALARPLEAAAEVQELLKRGDLERGKAVLTVE